MIAIAEMLTTLITLFLFVETQTHASVDQVAVGGFHTCAISGDTLTCWGNNQLGQTEVPADLGIPLSVAAGTTRTCVLALKDSKKSLHCWGEGNNEEKEYPRPSDVEGMTAIKGGVEGFCGVYQDSSTLKCWGSPYSIPRRHSLPDSLAFGVGWACGLLPDGAIACSGEVDPASQKIPAQVLGGNAGQICWADSTGLHCETSLGANIPGSLKTPSINRQIRKIVGGLRFGCALDESRTLICWGNDFGSLPWNKKIGRQVEAVDDVFSSGVGLHLCLKRNGALECFGDNSYGQLDVPQSLSPAKPTPAAPENIAKNVSDQDVRVTQIGVGAWHTCANVNDTPKCWGGFTLYGPAKIPSRVKNVIRFTGGAMHTCALTEPETGKRKVECWGAQDPENLTGPPLFPIFPVPEDLGFVTEIASGNTHVCALNSDHEMRCWGELDPPHFVAGVRSMALGLHFTCYIDLEGSVHCSGPDSPNLPENELKNVKAIGATLESICAAFESEVKCFNLEKLMPASLKLVGVRKIVGGWSHVCFLTVSEELHCVSEKKLESLISSPIPEHLSEVQDVVSQSGQHICIQTQTGVACYGNNSFGGQSLTPSNGDL